MAATGSRRGRRDSSGCCSRTSADPRGAALQDAVDRPTPRPPELLAILSKTFSDPARLTPAMMARADASVAGLGQQVSPARIIRTGIAVAYLDRLSYCREPLQRAIQHGREGGAVTSAIEALFLL